MPTAGVQSQGVGDATDSGVDVSGAERAEARRARPAPATSNVANDERSKNAAALPGRAVLLGDRAEPAGPAVGVRRHPPGRRAGRTRAVAPTRWSRPRCPPAAASRSVSGVRRTPRAVPATARAASAWHRAGRGSRGCARGGSGGCPGRWRTGRRRPPRRRTRRPLDDPVGQSAAGAGRVDDARELNPAPTKSPATSGVSPRQKLHVRREGLGRAEEPFVRAAWSGRDRPLGRRPDRARSGPSRARTRRRRRASAIVLSGARLALGLEGSDHQRTAVVPDVERAVEVAQQRQVGRGRRRSGPSSRGRARRRRGARRPPPDARGPGSRVRSTARRARPRPHPGR